MLMNDGKQLNRYIQVTDVEHSATIVSRDHVDTKLLHITVTSKLYNDEDDDFISVALCPYQDSVLSTASDAPNKLLGTPWLERDP